MALGYMGLAELEGFPLYTNSTGLNRIVEPLKSSAVWGSGWLNAAQTVAYSDSQNYFKGPVAFELSAQAALWNVFRDWAVYRRVYPKSVRMSPNGIVRYDYLADESDPRAGCWMGSISLRISAEALITVNAEFMALKRHEVILGNNYLAMDIQGHLPTAPLNPSPRNRNPIAGFTARAEIAWPNSPPWWSESNRNGMVLREADITHNNNPVLIKGCTGTPTAIAVLMGTMDTSGTITLFRDGPIPDPYGDDILSSPFTAESASIALYIGGSQGAAELGLRVPHVLLQSDSYDVKSQNEPTTRTFGFAAVGDGTGPPFIIDAAS